ncbi:hypothetical protein ACNOYE_37970 [Nannocystaceae bacterium ST9]
MSLPSLPLLALLVGPADLSWQAVEECPGTRELEAAIAGWLDVAPAEGEEVRARGRIEAWAGGYRLDLNIQLGPREQGHVLESHDCAELTELAALLIASAIDPFVLGQPTPESDVFEHLDAIVVVPATPRFQPAFEPARVPERVVEGPREAVPEPTHTIDGRVEPELESEPEPELEFGPIAALDDAPTRRRPRLEGFVASSGIGYAGLFQRPSGGIELLGGIDRGALRVAVGAAGWFGGRFRSSTDEGVGGNLQAGSALLEVCGVPSFAGRRPVGIPLCATGTAGAIVGTGVGVASPATVVRPWAAAGADIGVRWRVHPRVALRFGIGALVSLIRPIWQVAGPVVAFVTPQVLGRLRLSLEVFPGRR